MKRISIITERSDIVEATLAPGQDGYIVAHCPTLKGCVSQGHTEQEALKNIREAIVLYLSR